MVLPIAAEPVSPLGRHRLLAPSAAVRVSPLCLGGMNFGDAWKSFMGECDKTTTFQILDFFYKNGGNFIDTANNYQNQQSEIWIGEWMKLRGNRDEMVVATKFTFPYRMGDTDCILSNTAGNSAKSLHVSVEASLRKLQTSYLDLLYVHHWDYTTSIPELMQSLNDLIKARKLLYIGISDTPAWIVSRANEYARNHGLRQFNVYQGQWSAAQRDFERDIIPMCRSEGMALCPWGALGGGYFKTAAQREKADGRRMPGPIEQRSIDISEVLEKVASRHDSIITSIALAYVMHKSPYVFPIIGGRKIEHLKGNIQALTIRLSTDDITEIESALPFGVGFPMDFLSGDPSKGPKSPQDVQYLRLSGVFDFIQSGEPILPPGKI